MKTSQHESNNDRQENFELTKNDVKQAYLYLKNYVYYENYNFFLKQKIAEFEDNSFDSKINALASLLNNESFTSNSDLQNWLESIDCYVLPKSVKRDEERNANSNDYGHVIRNLTSSKKYCVEKVNYFLNAPVELHIIDVLWCLVVGPLLDKNLTQYCFGNRLDRSSINFIHRKNDGENSPRLFKYFIEQYSSWRDQGINKAINLHKKKENVALLSLDLKSYFYNVDLDFSKIASQIEMAFEDSTRLRDIAIKLNDALEKIFDAYKNKNENYLSLTHSECSEKLGLPIGLASSTVLANWYLAEFDEDTIKNARPDYYGRYVDDIIMVFRNPWADDQSMNSTKSIIDKFLIKQLIKNQDDQSLYVEVANNQLPVQEEKIIIHLLDKGHSRAVLEVFKEQLKERSSAFRFLPSEDIEGELDRFAYDILYDGSRNKLRSITGVREDSTELSSYLARHIILHRLCRMEPNDNVPLQLEHFFKGKNVLTFSRLWEKVYQYAVVIRDYRFLQKFYEYLNSEIDKAGVYPKSANSHRNEDLSRKLQGNLKLYNKISLGLSVALLNMGLFQSGGEISDDRGIRSENVLLPLVRNGNIGSLAKAFRISNLIRHHLVAWPMANFTDFEGDLTNEQKFRKSAMNKDLGLNLEKIDRSPRFIHFDELQLFFLQKSLANKEQGSLLKWQNKFIEGYGMYSFKAPSGDPTEELQDRSDSEADRQDLKEFIENFSSSEQEESEKSNKYNIVVGEKTKTPYGKIRIALANIEINNEDIENAIRKDKESNISFERQENFYEIINSAVEENVDVLVMPELSTPVSWLPFMVAHCRRHQLAMIFPSYSSHLQLFN